VDFGVLANTEILDRYVLLVRLVVELRDHLEDGLGVAVRVGREVLRGLLVCDTLFDEHIHGCCLM
jgi:hypothetical protein